MGPRFRDSSERLEKPGIEPTTPGLEGEQLNQYATDMHFRCLHNYARNRFSCDTALHDKSIFDKTANLPTPL